MVTVLDAGSFVRTSLDGYIKSVNPLDPDDCFNRPNSYYLGSELLMIQGADTLWYPVHMCGSTNTGLNWNGCAGGKIKEAVQVIGTPLDKDECNWVATGETVIAQACVQDKCTGYILDTTFEPIVTIAKIDGQWHIIGVISGDAVVPVGLTHVLGPEACSGACCGIGVKYLDATISSPCGALGGLTFELASTAGGGSWSGSVSANGETFSLTVTCTVDVDGSEDWAANGGCAGLTAADPLEVTCSTTGTGVGAGGMSGEATFPASGCTACSNLVVTFVASSKTPADECHTTINYTGETVIAEACGLPDLAIDDHVIMARVPKIGMTGTGTGTGSPEADQWYVVRACSGIDCDPCPPPDPPEDAECCGLTTATVPLFLTGSIGILGTGDAADCTCGDTIVFEWDGHTIPPVWNQVGSFDCPGPDKTGTASGLFTGMVGLSIQCASALTGTGSGAGPGTGTGTGPAGFFLAGLLGCTGVDSHRDSGYACDPVFVSFGGIDVVGCCSAQDDLPITGTVTLSLEVSA